MLTSAARRTGDSFTCNNLFRGGRGRVKTWQVSHAERPTVQLTNVS